MDDASLASDMIRLLRDEIERVREEIQEEKSAVRRSDSVPESVMVSPAELYALQEENASLYREVEAVRTQVYQIEAQSDRVVRTNTEVRELEEERAGRALKSKEESEKLEKKLEIALQKYQRYQKAHSDVSESVRDVEQLLQETKARRKEEKRRLKVLQTELEELRRADRGFDPRRFIDKASPNNAVTDAPKEVIATSVLAFDLPKSLLDLCVPEGYITKNSDEIVWPTEGKTRSHCLSICSTHRYNPKLNGGHWEPSWDLQNQGKTRDFFYMEEQKRHYLGTYRKEGQAIVASDDIRELVHAHMHYVLKRTVLFPALVPPVLTGIAKDMLYSGALKLVCIGWRRVGWNSDLAEALRRRRGSTSTGPGGRPPTPGTTVIRMPQEGSTKRDSESRQDGPRKKQRAA
ncbi:hypothetical protein C8Q79DRAFT_934768 [Trametes meyenii]|nr:hypothetical protein C8Q79DRAFT_934768 [Trametes meyenii]